MKYKLFVPILLLVSSSVCAQFSIPEDFIWKLHIGESKGTCFFIHKEGYLLTAAHNFWDQQSDGGLIEDWQNATFKIVNKNGDELEVKVVDIQCDKFYKKTKICNKTSGFDVALLEVIDKQRLRRFSFDIPEILMRNTEKLPLNNALLYGYAPDEPSVTPFTIPRLDEVSPSETGMSEFIRTNNNQWYTRNIDFRLVKSGFSGGPILKTSNNKTEIVGLFTSRYNSGRGFAEMTKSLDQIFMKVNLGSNPQILSVLNNIKNGVVKRSDIDPLTRLEVFYLISYLFKNQKIINKNYICHGFFKIKDIKLISPGFIESVLFSFIKNGTISSSCSTKYIRKADLGDFIFKNQSKIVDVEILKWGYKLYEEASLEEMDNFSQKRKLAFFDSFANAASILGDKTRDFSYYAVSIENSLKAGLLSSQLDKRQFRYAENAANVLNKIGDSENSLYFFEKAYVERAATNNNPSKVVEDIIYLKGKQDNKLYKSSEIEELIPQKGLIEYGWTKKIGDFGFNF